MQGHNVFFLSWSTPYMASSATESPLVGVKWSKSKYKLSFILNTRVMKKLLQACIVSFLLCKFSRSLLSQISMSKFIADWISTRPTIIYYTKSLYLTWILSSKGISILDYIVFIGHKFTSATCQKSFVHIWKKLDFASKHCGHIVLEVKKTNLNIWFSIHLL